MLQLPWAYLCLKQREKGIHHHWYRGADYLGERL